MNNHIIGTDMIVGIEKSKEKAPAKKGVNFLQRPAFGGLKIWQAGLAGLGVAMVLGGVITLVVKK